MVSSSHEAMHRIFQDHPGLFSRVSEALSIPFPQATAVSVLPNDVTETRPVDRRIDTLLRIDTEEHGPFLLAVEAQKRKDPEKPASWGYYLAYLRRSTGCRPCCSWSARTARRPSGRPCRNPSDSVRGLL
ncbi:hypothetical protein GCM10022384_42420 [Streptomyces marokkonensis]|uniref:Transposase n=1 Tax=Streptomyces marokkonensis TaxID=324855 RepID=A0ABP7QYY8_9ACTN